MDRENGTPSERYVTSDPATIRMWDEEHALVPVRSGAGGEGDLDVVLEGEVGPIQERLSWVEFGRELDRQGKVVVRRGEMSYTVRDRSAVTAADSSAAAADRSAVDESGAVDTDAEPTPGSVTTGHTATPSEDDEGKVVVNASGDDVGLVVDVDDGQMYVDPTPSLTDRIRSALGWGSHDEDASPIDASHVERIEAEQVVLDVDHEREPGHHEREPSDHER